MRAATTSATRAVRNRGTDNLVDTLRTMRDRKVTVSMHAAGEPVRIEGSEELERFVVAT